MEILITLILRIIAAMVVMMNREALKSFTAYMVTHPVYRDQLDYSSNWLKYVDPIGVCMMVFMNFGWQKPKEYKSSRYRDKSKGTLLVALTGFMANIFTIVLIIPFMRLEMNGYLYQFLAYVVFYSVSITVVNLFPVTPFDMSKMIKALAPNSYLSLIKYESYIHMGFIVFVAIGFGTIMMEGLFNVVSMLL